MKVPFESENKGKCASCEEDKHLDMMVRKKYQKGEYECIDCKVETELWRYVKPPIPVATVDNNNITFTMADEVKLKMTKFTTWVMG